MQELKHLPESEICKLPKAVRTHINETQMSKIADTSKSLII